MPLQYQEVARLLHPEGHSDGVTTVAFSPNGLLLASGGMDGRVCIWSTRKYKLLYVFSGKSSVLSLVWLKPSNEELVCGMEDGTIASLRISVDIIELNGFLAHRYPVERLAIKGAQLASGAHREVKIWSRAADGSWTEVGELDTPPQSSYTTGSHIVVTSLHWTSAPKRPSILLITYMSHGIVAFDVQKWQRIRATHIPGLIADASITADGQLLVISNMLTGFELFHVKAPAEVEPIFSFKQDVSARQPLPVCFLHGDCAIVGGASHGQVNLWDIFSRLKQSLHLGGGASVLAVAAHYDPTIDRFLVATGTFKLGRASPITVWQAKETRNRRSFLKGVLYASSMRVKCDTLWGVVKWGSVFVALLFAASTLFSDVLH